MRSGVRIRWPETLLVAYWIVLTTATHWPKLPGIDIPGKDKTAHVLAYTMLAGFVLNVAARRLGRYRRAAIVAGTMVTVGLLGAIDERTQPYFGRCCDLNDWLADMAGAGTACLAYVVGAWWQGRRQAGS